jgi:hypothetical protein
MESRLDSAAMVVVGKVTSVQLPSSEATPRASARAASTTARPPGPISEHDPQWRDAVIDVERVEKGPAARKQVVVRFPASDDVRWFRAPKFAPGDQGVFILHRPEARQPVAAGAAARTLAGDREVFTALDPADVQPADLQEEIETIVKAAPAGSRSVKRPSGTRSRKVSRVRAAPKRR